MVTKKSKYNNKSRNTTLKKADLINEISNITNLPVSETEEIINFAIDIMSDRIAKGEKVYLSGFGTFEMKKRAEHKAQNPRTGEEIMINSYYAPVFRASTTLKERVNKK